VLTTAALAATIPHHMSDNALLQNPKMLLEHDLVIADLIQALTPYPTQSGPTQVKKLKHLKHLFTPITTLLDPKAAFCNWFSRLHPSAAVGWFPRSQDAQLSHPWQKNMQNYQQLLGLYAGVFGLYLGGDLAFGYVLLRAVQHLQLSDQLINAQAPSPAANFFHTPHYQWLLAAGAGVIAQSEPEHEWQELLSKLNAIRRQIPIESL
jgi:isochorismate synthase EntC